MKMYYILKFAMKKMFIYHTKNCTSQQNCLVNENKSIDICSKSGSKFIGTLNQIETHRQKHDGYI